jgi:hypothetical protein
MISDDVQDSRIDEAKFSRGRVTSNEIRCRVRWTKVGIVAASRNFLETRASSTITCRRLKVRFSCLFVLRIILVQVGVAISLK